MNNKERVKRYIVSQEFENKFHPSNNILPDVPKKGKDLKNNCDLAFSNTVKSKRKFKNFENILSENILSYDKDPKGNSIHQINF